MTVIANDSTRFTDVVAYELEPQLSVCRESVVINDPAGATYKVGTVLGKITASGKYRQSLSASADGSQTPAAVYIADGMGSSTDLIVTAATDTKALVLARGPAILIDSGLQLGTGTTLAAVKTAFAPLLVEVETGI
jgi:hypothetical protein